jgi:hypothetical protein
LKREIQQTSFPRSVRTATCDNGVGIPTGRDAGRYQTYGDCHPGFRGTNARNDIPDRVHPSWPCAFMVPGTHGREGRPPVAPYSSVDGNDSPSALCGISSHDICIGPWITSSNYNPAFCAGLAGRGAGPLGVEPRDVPGKPFLQVLRARRTCITQYGSV